MILAAALHIASALRNADEDVARELDPRRGRDRRAEEDRDPADEPRMEPRCTA